jgi:predicted nucleotidyltransferase
MPAEKKPKKSRAEKIKEKVKKKAKVSKADVEKKRKEFVIDSARKSKQFAAMVRDKFGKYIRTVLISGSITRSDFVSGSDVDVYVIFDDTATDKPFTSQMREGLYNQLCEMAAKLGKEPHVHVQLATVTEFVDGIRTANPIIFNFVRNGRPILDTGFFEPLKRMLYMGIIKPGKETVIQTLEASIEYLNKVRTYHEWSVERMYKAVTWSTNSILMASGREPVGVDFMVDALGELVSNQVLEPEHVRTLEKIVELQRLIEQGKASDLQFETIADYYEKSREFVKKSEQIVKDYASGKLRADALKDKVASHPKIFWIDETGSRGYAWLFEDSILAAVYSKQSQKIYKAPVQKQSLGDFEEAEPKELFQRLELTKFKPMITPELILLITSKLNDKLKIKIKQIGVEYPGRALIDLSEILLKKSAEV